MTIHSGFKGVSIPLSCLIWGSRANRRRVSISRNRSLLPSRLRKSVHFRMASSTGLHFKRIGLRSAWPIRVCRAGNGEGAQHEASEEAREAAAAVSSGNGLSTDGLSTTLSEPEERIPASLSGRFTGSPPLRKYSIRMSESGRDDGCWLPGQANWALPQNQLSEIDQARFTNSSPCSASN